MSVERVRIIGGPRDGQWCALDTDRRDSIRLPDPPPLAVGLYTGPLEPTVDPTRITLYTVRRFWTPMPIEQSLARHGRVTQFNCLAPENMSDADIMQHLLDNWGPCDAL